MGIHFEVVRSAWETHWEFLENGTHQQNAGNPVALNVGQPNKAWLMTTKRSGCGWILLDSSPQEY